jgi:predicted RNA-binding protein associated with RNAse of E/G family
VTIEMTKWVDRPHWRIPGFWLGRDAHGDWLGFPTGTFMSRPGAEVTTSNDQVGLVPADGGWLATFHGPGGVVWTYVDMTTVPHWDGATVRAVDLDLDVVERLDHTVFVDDEDEFEEHRLEYGYPDDVVSLATSTRDDVLAAVRERRTPFDGTSAPWLEQVAGLSPSR